MIKGCLGGMMPYLVKDLIKMFLVSDVIFALLYRYLDLGDRKGQWKDWLIGIVIGQIMAIIGIYISIYSVLG